MGTWARAGGSDVEWGGRKCGRDEGGRGGFGGCAGEGELTSRVRGVGGSGGPEEGRGAGGLGCVG